MNGIGLFNGSGPFLCMVLVFVDSFGLFLIMVLAFSMCWGCFREWPWPFRGIGVVFVNGIYIFNGSGPFLCMALAFSRFLDLFCNFFRRGVETIIPGGE